VDYQRTNNPEWVRRLQEQQREWRREAFTDPERRKRHREQVIKSYIRRKNNPERWDRFLESKRLYAGLKRLDAGMVPTPQKSPKAYAEKRKHRKVELKPVPKDSFVDWVEERKKLYPTYIEFSKTCGVSPRELDRVCYESNGSVSFFFVDKCLTNEGSTHPIELYPEMYDF